MDDNDSIVHWVYTELKIKLNDNDYDWHEDHEGGCRRVTRRHVRRR